MSKIIRKDVILVEDMKITKLYRDKRRMYKRSMNIPITIQEGIYDVVFIPKSSKPQSPIKSQDDIEDIRNTIKRGFTAQVERVD